MVRADPDPDVHDQLRVHGDAAGAVLDHAGGAVRGVPGPGELVIVLATNLREVCTIPTRAFLLGPSPGWKRLLALSHLRHYFEIIVGAFSVILTSSRTSVSSSNNDYLSSDIH